MTPTLARESALWAKGCRYVAGLDEVGRGPLAGPVVAAAVVLPQNATIIAGLRDSKQMTARQRDRVAGVIRDIASAWAVGAASPREIDRLNILGATALAMRRALSLLSEAPLLSQTFGLGSSPGFDLCVITPLQNFRNPLSPILGRPCVTRRTHKSVDSQVRHNTSQSLPSRDLPTHPATV